MHDGIDSPIEQPVFGGESRYPEGTRRIVLPAAAVRLGEATQVGILARRIPFTTPLGARNS